MANKRLVVIETDPLDPDAGRLQPLDPQQVSGVPLPSFRFGPQTPAAGTIAGQAFINTTSHVASVWDGTRWNPITPSVVVSWPDDATLLADNPPAGTYGFSLATGNLFVRTTGLHWKQVGVRIYANQAALLASTNPQDGDMAVTRDHGIMYVYVIGNWYPKTTFLDSEAGILGNTWCLNGQLAIATDTGHIYVRSNNQWIGSPIATYPTDAQLKAATPKDGVVGLARDTGHLYVRVNSKWVSAGGSNLTEDSKSPAVAKPGDLWWDTRSKALRIYSKAKTWSLAANFNHGTTTPTAGVVDGSLFYNDTTKEASLHVPGGWRKISSSRTVTKQINQVQQCGINLPGNAYKQVKFELAVFIRTASQIQLIGQTKSTWWELRTKINGSLTREAGNNNALRVVDNPHHNWAVDGARMSGITWEANRWLFLKGSIARINDANAIMKVNMIGAEHTIWREIDIVAHFHQEMFYINEIGFKTVTGNNQDWSLFVEYE